MEILGRGGHGTIYSTSNPKNVIKIHEGPINCNHLSDEFVRQQSAYEINKHENSNIGVPKPSQWRLNDDGNGCSFLMERIYPPDNGKYSWHVYWEHEDPNFDYIHDKGNGAIRGRYLGLARLQDLVPDLNFSELSYDAGFLLASIQYGSLQTARDTELILGSLYKEDLKLFLVDYDKSHSWFMNDPPYEELVATLEDEPYWPYPGSKLYPSFERGYLKAAENYHLKAVAKKVLKER